MSSKSGVSVSTFEPRIAPFACAIGATVSVMLAGLLSVEMSLENPFSPSLDAVRVHHELARAREGAGR